MKTGKNQKPESGKENINIKKEKNFIPDKLFLLGGILFLTLFCISAVSLVRYYMAYRGQEKDNATFADLRKQDLVQTNTMELLADIKFIGKEKEQFHPDVTKSEFYKINSDYVGYVSIPETELSYPVVQRDNAYYLKHDFYGEKNSHGAIFLDENSQITGDVLLIHGHHMKDGTMFYLLKEYKKEGFLEKHPAIFLDLGMGDEAYEVFGLMLVDFTKEDSFDYSELPLNSVEKTGYLERLKEHSLWWREEVLENTEPAKQQILLLSTCDYGTADQRLVVGAIKK